MRSDPMWKPAMVREETSVSTRLNSKELVLVGTLQHPASRHLIKTVLTVIYHSLHPKLSACSVC
jgi:hypothetical protein